MLRIIYARFPRGQPQPVVFGSPCSLRSLAINTSLIYVIIHHYTLKNKALSYNLINANKN
ncbi:hypothetical protein CD142_00005 [Staphylococcus schleiferi subsp. schleiferi]|nr:hypothetical protein [Staphylococcus schleiferi]RTX82618.1 hypothetical protein CD142_00005 [Staphylococcus schleiferi subsp. schleiferi]